MKLEISANLKSLEKALNAFPKETFKAVNLELKKGARDVQVDARANHRFTTRTGALERSVETRLSPSLLRARVGINKRFAKYGKYIHDGFKSWKPDRFITKAGEAKKEDLKKDIQRAVARVMRGKF